MADRFRLNIRTDWINATNHEDFATATGNNNRIVVLGARINF